MFENDDFGYFNSANHIENFLFYLNTFYTEAFQNLEYTHLPENEIAFLYVISELFEKPMITQDQDFSELMSAIESLYPRLSEDFQTIVEIAYSLLHHSIHVNDIRKLPPETGIVIKNAIDILSENNDVVQFKQYEIVSIARNYFVLQSDLYNNYELSL